MKHISIFIVLVLLLALTACSRDPAQSKPSDASQEPRASSPQEQEYASLCVNRTPFAFQDDAGDTLQTDEALNLTGTLANDPSLDYIEEPACVRVDVQLCDQYEFQNLSKQDAAFVISASSGHAHVTGSGIERVVFHRDTRRLELFGTDMTYRLYLGADDAAGVDACLSGTASGDFSVAIENGAVVTTGLTGTQSWGFSVTGAIYPAMTEAEFPLAEPLAIPSVTEIVEANRKWEAEHYGES